MSIRFPDSWQLLSLPYIRAELIEFLKELGSSEYQKKHWPSSAPPTEQVEGIDSIFHFFFDDNDFSDASSHIGFTLINAEEAKQVAAVTAELDRIFKDIGDAPSEAYMAHRHWPKVLEAAASALSCLLKNGAPVFI